MTHTYIRRVFGYRPLLLLALSLLLAACGDGGGGGGGSAPTYTIGGTVSGLSGTVVLQNNGGDDLTILADGSFSFATSLANGTAYAVTVLTQPSIQTCTVTSGGSGTISGANVTSVAVACVTNTYNVGGSVSGLSGTVVLQNNGGDDLTITADGPFSFSTPVNDGAAYAATILTQPVGQACTVANGSGTIAGANVTNLQVGCISDIAAITAGDNHTVALKVNGTVWAWGDNNFGQLGDGMLVDSVIPVPVTGLTDVTAIAGGADHTVALKSDGTVWAWGYNNSGQLGDGTNANSAIPMQVCVDIGCTTYLAGVAAIAVGGWHSVALMNDGTVRAWGKNTSGQLGDGMSVDSVIPVPVTGLTGISAIAGGAGHTIALKTDNTVWTWGYNAYGQLGNTTLTPSSIPIQVSGLADVTAIAGGTNHTIVLKADGTVWAWGQNNNGQLGDGSTAYKTIPVQACVDSGCTSYLAGVIAIAGGGEHTVALKADRTAWTWGRNNYGQLGDGDGALTNSTIPMQVCVDTLCTSYLADVAAIAGGLYHSVALKTNGTVWTWGYNNDGQLGDGTNANSAIPVQVIGLMPVIAIAGGTNHNIALKADGTVWVWGENSQGQLGDGTQTDSATPVQVCAAGETAPCSSFLTDVSAIAGGFRHTIALKTDGTVWGWGANNSGQLGNLTTTRSTTPVQVCADSGCTSYLADVAAIAGGLYHSVALKTDGTVWGWGQNGQGQLGDGMSANTRWAVQVCAAGETAPCSSFLTGVSAITSGDDHTIALKTDGTVWTWGFNNLGQLGDGTTDTGFIPAQVSGLTGVAAIAGGRLHGVALKTDSTVWAWGYGGRGQLGDGTSGATGTTPVQVCAAGETAPCSSFLTGVTAIAGGYLHTIALKTDGTVWAWGYNINGALGDGTTGGDATTPVQVCAAGGTAPCSSFLTGVTATAGGGDHSIALKTAGTVWTWGQNAYGQLGDGTQIDSSTPVKVLFGP